MLSEDEMTQAPTFSDLDGNALSELHTWTSKTPRLHLVNSSCADGTEFAASHDSVHLSFSLPVEAEAAREYLEASCPIRSVMNDGDSTLVAAPFLGPTAER